MAAVIEDIIRIKHLQIVHLNLSYRHTFRYEEGDAFDVDYLDYH